MSTRRYSVVFISLVLFATTNPTVEGQSLSWLPIAPGVNYAIPESALGEDVFIGIGGVSTWQAWVDSWVEALNAAKLHSLKIGHLYSVHGPRDIAYQGREIGTLELARHLSLLMQSYPESDTIIVAGHSSGAFVAHALFQDLYDGASVDSTHSTDGKIHYFVLDARLDNVPTGVELTSASADRLEHIYGVHASFPSRSLYSLARNDMIALGERYGSRSSSLEIDASKSGCNSPTCMHMTMINQKPYNSSNYDSRDYSAINPDHPVQTAYLDSAFPTNTATDDAPPLPTEFALHGNFPNPFNPTTTISYDLPRAADATLTVFDVLGRQVSLLASGAKPAGSYEFSFDARGLTSGVYFYRIQAGDYVETKRMVIVK